MKLQDKVHSRRSHCPERPGARRAIGLSVHHSAHECAVWAPTRCRCISRPLQTSRRPLHASSRLFTPLHAFPRPLHASSASPATWSLHRPSQPLPHRPGSSSTPSLSIVRWCSISLRLALPATSIPCISSTTIPSFSHRLPNSLMISYLGRRNFLSFDFPPCCKSV